MGAKRLGGIRAERAGEVGGAREHEQADSVAPGRLGVAGRELARLDEPRQLSYQAAMLTQPGLEELLARELDRASTASRNRRWPQPRGDAIES